MLDNLDDAQLQQFYELLDIARNGNAVEAESHPVLAPLNAPAPTVESVPVPVAVASEPAKRAPVVEPPISDRDEQLARADELLRLLKDADPLTRIGDPIVRSQLITA